MSLTILFRPLLTSGMLAEGEKGMYIVIDSEQSEHEQGVTLWHEVLHLLGLTDEGQVEELAKRLHAAAPEVVGFVRDLHDPLEDGT